MTELQLKARHTLSTWFHAGNFPLWLVATPFARARYIEALRERLKSRRLIFCISPGRSGSGFLARLLGRSGDVVACHEPKPQMTGSLLYAAVGKPLQESFNRRQIKLIGINRQLLRMKESMTYVETSHMFIKSFYDVVLDYYRNVTVIVLRRDMSKVLKSFLELGYFTTINPHWKLWMHEPREGNGVVPPILPFSEMDATDRAIAYLLDIDGRAEKFARDYPAVPSMEVSLEDLETNSGSRRLLQGLDLPMMDDGLVAELARNERQEFKPLSNRVSLEYCRERILGYLAEAGNRGTRVPKHSLEMAQVW